MTPAKKQSISLSPEIFDAMKQRDDALSTAIEQSLDRYLEALAYTRKRLSLTDGECGLILDVLNGTMFADPFSIRMLPHEIADSRPDGYAEKWNVDIDALVAKLSTYGPLECLAVVDAVERWWERVSRGEQPAPGDLLK